MKSNKILAKTLAGLFVVLVGGIVSLKMSRHIYLESEKELKKQEFLAAANNQSILANQEAKKNAEMMRMNAETKRINKNLYGIE